MGIESGHGDLSNGGGHSGKMNNSRALVVAEAKAKLATPPDLVTGPYAMLSAKPVHHRAIRLKLHRIVEGLEPGDAVASFQCARNEPVGDSRILGQERPVDVGAKHILVSASFVARGVVVALTMQHLAQRADVRP